MSNFIIGAQMYSVRDHCENEREMLNALKAIKAMGTTNLTVHQRRVNLAALDHLTRGQKEIRRQLREQRALVRRTETHPRIRKMQEA
jgi:predicted choloylglycine hydrolase